MSHTPQTTRQLLRRLGALMVSAGLMTSLAGIAWMSPAAATGSDYAGNKDCAAVGDNLQEFKIEGVPEARSYEVPNSGLVITFANSSSQSFDWASNDYDIAAVLVKGGEGGGGVGYMYPGAVDFKDTGLHALADGDEGVYHGISHVTFCFTVATPPTTSPPTTMPGQTPPPGETSPPAEQPVAVSPAGEQQPLATPVPAVNPAAVGAEVQGVTLTLPRTGSAATPALVLFGGLGLALGLAMLLLGNRKAPIEIS